jgi:hypothetical protein
MKELAAMDDDDCCGCCSSGFCKNRSNAISESRKTSRISIVQFFRQIKILYAAALGIEILCIAAAEIGEDTGLYILGFNHIGVPIAYAMGYGLASFTTFATILGRYEYDSGNKIDGCCSVLDQGDNKGFFSNVIITLKNFSVGLKKMSDLPKQPNLKEILKRTLIILIAAGTGCIVTAETTDLIFFKQAIYISVPLALLAGAFTVVAPEAYRKLKKSEVHD